MGFGHDLQFSINEKRCKFKLKIYFCIEKLNSPQLSLGKSAGRKNVAILLYLKPPQRPYSASVHSEKFRDILKSLDRDNTNLVMVTGDARQMALASVVGAKPPAPAEARTTFECSRIQ